MAIVSVISQLYCTGLKYSGAILKRGGAIARALLGDEPKIRTYTFFYRQTEFAILYRLSFIFEYHRHNSSIINYRFSLGTKQEITTDFKYPHLLIKIDHIKYINHIPLISIPPWIMSPLNKFPCFENNYYIKRNTIQIFVLLKSLV